MIETLRFELDVWTWRHIILILGLLLKTISPNSICREINRSVFWNINYEVIKYGPRKIRTNKVQRAFWYIWSRLTVLDHLIQNESLSSPRATCCPALRCPCYLYFDSFHIFHCSSFIFNYSHFYLIYMLYNYANPACAKHYAIFVIDKLYWTILYDLWCSQTKILVMKCKYITIKNNWWENTCCTSNHVAKQI